MAGSIVTVPKTKVSRRIGTLTYQAGTKQQLRVDQDGVLLKTNIRLTFTVTNGGTGPVSAKPFALARLLRRVEFTVNGQDTFISHDGASLVARAIIEDGVRPYGFDATVVLTNSAATTYTVVVPISHVLPRAVRPDDTAVDLRAPISQCVISVDWGDASDLFNTPGAAAVSAVTCAVEGVYLVNPAPTDKFMVRELTLQTQDVSATNSDLGVLLDRGAYYYRSFNILSVSDGLLVNTMLNSGSVKLVSGSMVFFDRVGSDVLGDQASMYKLPVAERQSGLYRLEQTTDGQNTTLINAGALLADLYLRFNVTKVGTTDQLIISRETMRTFNI